MTLVDRAWAAHRKTWHGHLRPRTLFGVAFLAGYQAAVEREPIRLQLDQEQLAELGLAVLTPDEIDLVAPALLEAGTRHLERPGTAWQSLGHRLHTVAERLYAAANRTTTKEHA